MREILIDPEFCDNCRRCESACRESHPEAAGICGGPRLRVLKADGLYQPLLCRHCEDAPCLEACMSGAMQRDAATGMVFVEAARCRGCWMCIMACPFGVIQPDAAAGQAHKCDGCYGRETAACAAACEPGALRVLEMGAAEKARRRQRGLRERPEVR